MKKAKRYDLYRNQPGREPVRIGEALTERECKAYIEDDAEWLSRAMRLSDFEIRDIEWTAEFPVR